MQAKQMWTLIDRIDCHNTDIELWLSNLALVTYAVDQAALTLPNLSIYANALHLTLQGITHTQIEQRSYIDQAFVLVNKERTNGAQSAVSPTPGVS